MSLYGPEELISSPMWQESPPAASGAFSYATDPDLLREGQQRVLAATGEGTLAVNEPLTRTARRYFLTVEAMATNEASAPLRFGLRGNDSTGAEVGFFAVTADRLPARQWRQYTVAVDVPEHVVELVPQIRTQSGSQFYVAWVSARQVTEATSAHGWSLTYAMATPKDEDDSGTGVVPPISEQGRTPKAPTGLQVAGGTSTSSGRPLGTIVASWQPVTATTNDEIITGVRYAPEWRYDTGPWTALPVTSLTTVTLGGLEDFGEYRFRVRADFEGKYSAYVSTTVDIPVDDVPPPAPSRPQVHTALGVINHIWDGAADGGGAMPADFTHLNVGLRVGTTTTIVSRLHSAGTGIPIPGAPKSTDLQVGYQAVDASGNASPWTYSETLRVAGVLDDASDFFDGKSLAERFNEQLAATEEARRQALAALDEAESLKATSINIEHAAREIISNAREGMRVAAEVWALANGKERLYYQVEAPPGDTGGVWVNTSDDNRFHEWIGGQWREVVTSTTITHLNNIATAEQMVMDAQQSYLDALAKVEDLDARAIVLEDQAALAQQELDGLSEDLLQAFADADAAMRAANLARGTADTAQHNATLAYNIANEKGRVIFSATAPTTNEDRKVQNLWIDLSLDSAGKPKNTPHRWLNGQWVEITDQAVRDAAAAAAAAHQRANEAHTLAGQAKSTADSALSSASSKATIQFATSPPSGQGAREGDIWWQHGANGTIIGQWIWRAGTSNWEKQQLASEIIANLDVGKLVVGQATIIDLEVINTFTAEIAEVIELRAKNLKAEEIWGDEAWLGHARVNLLTVGSIPQSAMAQSGTELLPDPMFEKQLLTLPAQYFYSTLNRRNGQARTLRMSGVAPRLYLSEQFFTTPGMKYHLVIWAQAQNDVYDAAVGVEVYNEAGALISEQYVAPPGEPDPDDENAPPMHPMSRQFLFDGVVEIPEGGFRVRPFVGLKPGESGTSAQYWYFSEISMKAVLSQRNENDWVTEVTGRGLTVINPSGEESIRLGAFESTGLTLYQEGEVRSLITDSGEVGGDIVHANDQFWYRGDEMSDLLWDLPWGVVYNRNFPHARRIYATGGHTYIHFDALPARSYRVDVKVIIRNHSSQGVHVRFTHRQSDRGTNPVVPVTSSPVAAEGWDYVPATSFVGNAPGEHHFSFTYTPEGDIEDREDWKTASLLLVAEPAQSGSSVSIERAWWTVEDIGPSVNRGRAGGYSTSGGGSPPSGTAPVQPAPDTMPIRRKRTYGYQWHRTWEGGGASPAAAQDSCYQGRTPHYTRAGIYRSMVGIASMTSDLSGATIRRVRVRVRMDHSHNSSGGTVVVGLHGNTSAPSTWTNIRANGVVSSHFSRGQEKWLDIPSTHWSRFINGNARGISFYINSTNSKYYCKIRPSRVAVEVTYEIPG